MAKNNQFYPHYSPLFNSPAQQQLINDAKSKINRLGEPSDILMFNEATEKLQQNMMFPQYNYPSLMPNFGMHYPHNLSLIKQNEVTLAQQQQQHSELIHGINGNSQNHELNKEERKSRNARAEDYNAEANRAIER